ncbi:4-hydroxyphenylpyruvate dioxygenase [Thiotrichales bacterium 19S9-12]|nr:4-hydroxyphenylpyruvate dioxygenase [Thiotrichales bacterium 19S9-11]MCF6811759.1 4-hydroxyphenylpyruvate dioxygenase [Thiotrichales bacterium 19S9-12]
MESTHNPANTNGFAFLEYTSTDPESLATLFKSLGFSHVANHKEKEIKVYQQNNIFFLLNRETGGFAESFAKAHGGGVCSMGFLVKDPQNAYNYTKSQGAYDVESTSDDWHDDQIKLIHGIADTRLYLTPYANILDSNLFEKLPNSDEIMQQNQVGLKTLDHVTHNVFRGNMDKWAGFYEKLFNFREIRYFDIEGKLTGLFSRAMTSPCHKIRIPVNESADDKSQIEEFINDYHGEGIQHIALETSDIYQTVETLRSQGMDFMFTPDTYYKKIHERVPHHEESLERMQKNRILIDGAPTKDGGILLQIFTQTVIGPVFFEIIQRKGDEGFGEGNFQALFDSIELDQIERGVLEDNEK